MSQPEEHVELRLSGVQGVLALRGVPCPSSDWDSKLRCASLAASADSDHAMTAARWEAWSALPVIALPLLQVAPAPPPAPRTDPRPVWAAEAYRSARSACHS